jgi:hypothetical protein
LRGRTSGRIRSRYGILHMRRGVHRFLVGKPERKRPFGRLRLRWEENIKMYLQMERVGKYGLN